MQQVMLVTGGSRGIGAATARLAAERGYAVCVNYLEDRPAAETLVAELAAAGGRAAAVPGDVSNESDVVRRMSTRRGGSGGAIVNVSSAAARLGSAGEYVDYAASKGAVDTLTIGLANEVAAEGIRVNAVRPGLIYTDIHAVGG